MKLAVALNKVSALKQQIIETKERARAAAWHQEGEDPPEDVNELVEQGLNLIGRLETLVGQVNATNAATEIEPGLTLTAALARRDALSLAHKLVSEVANAAAGGRSGWGDMRIGRSELKRVSDLDVPTRRGQADGIAQQRRELDISIQQANWAVDLLE